MHFIKYFLIFFGALLFSCSKVSKESAVVPTTLNTKVEFDENYPNHKKIIIVSTNAILAQTKTQEESIGVNQVDKHEFIKVGGRSVISSYFNILRMKYPEETVFIDSGDILKNANSLAEKNQIINYFNYLNYDAISMGITELFNFGPFDLKGKKNQEASGLLKLQPTVINSNVLKMNTGLPFQNDVFSPYKLITKNGVKIGIISVAPYHLVTLKKKKLLDGYYFEDPVLTFLKMKRKLKKLGAQILIITTQLESVCKTKLPNQYKLASKKEFFQLRCPDNITPEELTKERDHLYRFVKRLPPNSVDLIIAGGTEESDGFVNEIPVLQNFGNGKYFSRIDFFYDRKMNQISDEYTKIHPPTKLCFKFFPDTNDCRKENSRNIAQENMKPAIYLGHEIVPSADSIELSINK
jgi:2',3'-cyclic-nucleotide 2'-phosphodiesterase (5'-nucleotidase family)